MLDTEANAAKSGPAAAIPWIEHVRTQLRRWIDAGSRNPEGTVAANDAAAFKRRRILELELEQLPYSLGGAYAALCRLETLAQEACQKINVSPKPNTNSVISLASEDTLSLSWGVDAFLDFMRRAQNAVCPYISRTFRQSNPQSLATLFDAIRRGKTRLPSHVQSLIGDYWSQSGSLVRAYRDLAQHHAAVSSDARMLIAPSGERFFYLLLPTSPEAKALRDLDYGEPPVHALVLCRDAFLRFFVFAYALMYLLLRYLGGTRGLTTMLLWKSGVSNQDFRGYHTLQLTDLDDALWGLRSKTRASCVEAFGEYDQPPLELPV